VWWWISSLFSVYHLERTRALCVDGAGREQKSRDSWASVKTCKFSLNLTVVKGPELVMRSNIGFTLAAGYLGGAERPPHSRHMAGGDVEPGNSARVKNCSTLLPLCLLSILPSVEEQKGCTLRYIYFVHDLGACRRSLTRAHDEASQRSLGRPGTPSPSKLSPYFG